MCVGVERLGLMIGLLVLLISFFTYGMALVLRGVGPILGNGYGL